MKTRLKEHIRYKSPGRELPFNLTNVSFEWGHEEKREWMYEVDGLSTEDERQIEGQDYKNDWTKESQKTLSK